MSMMHNDDKREKLEDTAGPEQQEMDQTDFPTSALMGETLARKLCITLVVWLTAFVMVCGLHKCVLYPCI